MDGLNIDATSVSSIQAPITTRFGNDSSLDVYSLPPDCRPGSYNFFPLSHVGWVLYTGLFEVGLILL